MHNKMKDFINVLGISILLFSTLTPIYTQVAARSSTTPKALNYKIIKVDNTLQVHLKLSGTGYDGTNKCYIRKSNDDATYGEIVTTDNEFETTVPGKLSRGCVGDSIKIGFDKFSPRTKYIAIFTDASNAATAAGKTTGGTVFGFDFPLLVNPQVTITTETHKLKLSTITCKKVNCPIYYKNVEYAVGTAATADNGCNTPNTANVVDFDLMIPYYEMRCEHYPSFFYKLQNNYTLENNDVYKPQYYVKKHDTDPKKYVLKFTNKFSYEICRFSIREASTTPPAANTNTYTSNCGGENKQCYAPCNNVELVFEPSKVVVEILIQPRYASLHKKGTTYYGYSQKKFVVTKTSDKKELLSEYTSTGVTLNVPLFKPEGDVKFDGCTVSYYEADKPTLTAPTPVRATCQVAGQETNQDCVTVCTTALVITDLGSGKPYILEIASGNTDGILTGFKEHIFIRTNKSAAHPFSETAPTVGEISATVKAVDIAGDVKNTDHTCAYYISPRGKDVYVCAFCTDSYPCRGYCKESHEILKLTPGTEYDIKVVAHKDYGFKVHQITTALSTLTLEKEFLDKGFKVSGVLSTADPTATCNYDVKVKKGETFELVQQCPTPPPTLKVAVNPGTPVVTSKLSKISVARSGSEQPANPTPETKVAPVIPTCTQLPLCTDIVISEGYEADKEYQIVVTSPGRSQPATINIPINPLPTVPTDVAKQLIVVIDRDGETFTVKSTLPEGVAENSQCKWELRNWEDPSKPIIKKCMDIGEGCTSFPPCKDFTIPNVPDTNKYHLVLYHSTDENISGTTEIDKGAKSSKSTIFAAAVPAVIVVAGIGFYFGYWRNRG